MVDSSEATPTAGTTICSEEATQLRQRPQLAIELVEPDLSAELWEINWNAGSKMYRKNKIGILVQNMCFQMFSPVDTARERMSKKCFGVFLNILEMFDVFSKYMICFP